jgi:lactate dehydrogenase-like 2-hydroxyacid dehydrogenase
MTDTDRRPRVLYLSHAPEALYDVMRQLAEPELELLTLDEDSDKERTAKLAGSDAVIVAAHPFTRALIEATPRLKFIQHQGVGYQDTIDMDAFRATGARLAITPAGTTTGVAEHTVLLALAVLRRLTFADSELRQGRWHINALRPESRELAGKTIGYIGMGRIGQAAAKRFHAFETCGVYYDPAVQLGGEMEAALSLRRATLNEVFTGADVLSLHVPLIEATRHIVNADSLSLMKPDAIVINTSRGPVIDEAALIEALQSERIAGAGLDVFETEPPSTLSPLMTMRNTVLTPHISAGTRDAFATKMQAVFANLHSFFAGEPLENEVAP